MSLERERREGRKREEEQVSKGEGWGREGVNGRGWGRERKKEEK